jgi:N-acetylglucosaminyldiphosphoundecaprenol N-acetyl-beta-D-mannosaminyltransferase
MEIHDHLAEFVNGHPVNDLERDVYCVLGMPIDAIDMPSILRRIDAAAGSHAPFFISTPNLNFLVNSRSDPEFRGSVLDSDLCPADGMPIVWISRLIDVPIRERVSGSDILEAVKTRDGVKRQLKMFLFGGAPGAAAAAARNLNALSAGVNIVGTLNPGFGALEEMSRDDIIDKVNSSGADFLAVSLGAKKGQLWLYRNHQRLTIPVRAHLGAAISFQAGTVRRAPPALRACGLEWLWRIKEEPHLWRRYTLDGLVLVRLLFAGALPLAILNRWHKYKWKPRELLISTKQDHGCVTIRISGDANRRNIARAISCFRETLTLGSGQVVIDLAGTRAIDGRFLGLLLMVRKCLNAKGAKLSFIGLSAATRRLFWLNQVNFLLNNARKAEVPALVGG